MKYTVLLLLVVGCSSNPAKMLNKKGFTPYISQRQLGTTHVDFNKSHLVNHLDPRYRVICPCCHEEQVLKPLVVQTTGGNAQSDGVIQHSSATFRCGKRDCQVVFTAICEDVFIPTPPPAVEITK